MDSGAAEPVTDNGEGEGGRRTGVEVEGGGRRRTGGGGMLKLVKDCSE